MLGRYKEKEKRPGGRTFPESGSWTPLPPAPGKKGDPFDQNVTREPAAGVGAPFAEGPASTESAAPEGEDPFEAETVPAEELGDPFAEETGGEGESWTPSAPDAAGFSAHGRERSSPRWSAACSPLWWGGPSPCGAGSSPRRFPPPPWEPEETVPEQPEEPAEPTDDELYPDDGYTGDMPHPSPESGRRGSTPSSWWVPIWGMATPTPSWWPPTTPRTRM